MQLGPWTEHKALKISARIANILAARQNSFEFEGGPRHTDIAQDVTNSDVAQNYRLIISITLFQVTVVLNLEAAGAVVAAGVV